MSAVALHLEDVGLAKPGLYDQKLSEWKKRRCSQDSAPRRVKKLKLRKGGSFPTFLVLDGCCTTSLPWTLE